ncbi:hypothetical protein EDD16DRAFT_1540902 [Pisolithus croceorrhizus]|nr:hypothetical protein EDD16DRAFT_1540902 [Pisolithus croceorrhizus]
MDVNSDIPDNVRAWHPSVRRPTNPPSPSTYHRIVDARFIFEIDVSDTLPSTAKAVRTRPTDAQDARTIFVVSPRCCYCRSIRQACSRSLPSCARCTQTGRMCVPVTDGYDTLPGPKTGRLTSSIGSGNHIPTQGHQPPILAEGQCLDGQNGNDIAKGKGNEERGISPIPTSTKRPPLANQDQETPRKRRKTLPELTSTTEVTETEPTPAPPVATSHPSTSQLTTSAECPSNPPALERRVSTPKFTPLQPASLHGPPATRWSLVGPSLNQFKSAGITQSLSPFRTLNPSRPPTPIACPPRAWTKTLPHLLSLFPELGKTQSGLTWGDCATPIMLLGKGKGANDEDAWVDHVSLNLSMTWKFVYDPRPPLPPPPPSLSVPRSSGIVQLDATDRISSRAQPHLDDVRRRSRPRDDLNQRISRMRVERRRTSPSSRRKEARNIPRKSSVHKASSISPVSDTSRTSSYVPGMYGGQPLFKPLPNLRKIPRHPKVPDHSQSGNPTLGSMQPPSCSETQAPQQPHIPQPGAVNTVGDNQPHRVNGFADSGSYVYPWRDPSNFMEDVVSDGGNSALSLTSLSTPCLRSAHTDTHTTISARTPNWGHFPTHYTQMQHTYYTNNTWSYCGSSNACNSMKNIGIHEVTQPTLPRELTMQFSAMASDNSQPQHEYEAGLASMASLEVPALVLHTSVPTESHPGEMLDVPDYDKQITHEQDIDIDTLVLPEESSNNVENTPAAMSTGDGSAPLISETRRSLASIQELTPVRTRPQDINILSDAKSHYIPVLVWAHQDSPLCPITPSPEYAYACLGYFFVASIEEDVVEWVRVPGTDELQGTVQWRFNLGWAPGGEEFLLDDHASTGTSPGSAPPHELEVTPVSQPDIMRPWWCPLPSPLTSKSISEYDIQNLRLRYYSYLPYDSLGSFHPNECSFTRGWFCRRCGLANAPLFFRHWICQSKTCMAKETLCTFPLGKVVPLPSVRDVYAQLPVPLPLNNVPHYLAVKEETWENEMLSYTYVLRQNVQAVYMFAANREVFQQEATKLWEDVQRDVVLRRESSAYPFFTYATVISSGGPDTNPREWIMSAGVPDCVVHAHNYLLHITEKYGRTDRPRFNRLSVVGWCTSGRKKWPNILGAKEVPLTILCLGTDVVLHLAPLGGYHNGFPDPFLDPGGALKLEEGCGVGLTFVQAEMVTKAPESSALSEKRVGEDNQERSTFAIGGGTIDAAGGGADTAEYQGGRAAADTGDKPDPGTSLRIVMESVGSQSTASIRTEGKAKTKQRNGKKAGPSVPPFSIVLMHGDSIILTGDDFECLVERKGTAMLVIGSAD